jgi:pantothenate kinase
MAADAAPVQMSTIDALADDLRRMAASNGRRLVLGLCGPPGTGKSTTALRDALGPDRVAVVQLDGFHIASNLLAGTELARRRGAIDTFDAASFAVLVERLRADDEDVVYVPTFERDLEEPINASAAVEHAQDVVIVEGNYLLADGEPWERVRACLDEVWYLHTDAGIRVPQLVDRHVRSGKSRSAAEDWVDRSDEANARLVESTRYRADRVLDLRSPRDARTAFDDRGGDDGDDA